MAMSKRNRLTVAIVSGISVSSAQIAGEQGVKFDLTKLSRLGLIAEELKVGVVGSH
jgi:hypothetical protein